MNYKNPISASENVVTSLIKDTIYYIPSRILPVLFGFIGLSIYTRVFSPEEYGNYSLILVTITLLGMFTYSWVNNSNLRFYRVYKDNNNLNIFYTTSFISVLLSIFIVSSILLVLYFFNFVGSAIASYLLYIILVILSTSFFETILNIMRCDRMAVSVSLYRSISSGFSLILSLVFIFIYDFNILSILISLFITNCIIALFLAFKLNFFMHINIKFFSIDVFKEFFKYGIPVMVTLLFTWILALSNRYIIEYFCGIREVGIYSAAYQLADYPISLFSSMIAMAAFPIIVDTWEKYGTETTRLLISKTTRYYILISLPILTGVIVLSKDLMYILGDSYSSGFILLPLICFSELLFGLCVFINKGLELHKKTTILAIIVGVSALFNIIINLIIVPKYGFVGAGLSSCISYSIYLLLSIYFSNKYLAWDCPTKTIANVVFSSILMGVILYAVKSYLIIPSFIIALPIYISLGFILYLLLLYLSGEIKSELRFITNLINKNVNF